MFYLWTSFFLFQIKNFLLRIHENDTRRQVEWDKILFKTRKVEFLFTDFGKVLRLREPLWFIFHNKK